VIVLRILQDIAELALVIASMYLAVHVYVQRWQAGWAGPLVRRRFAIIWLLTLGAVGIKMTEDVVGGESGPIDEAILRFVHARVAPQSSAVFEVITQTASATAMTTLTVVAAGLLLFAGRRAAAVLLVGSVACAASVVYAAKTIVGRARPALWDTQWYWGSSFPSGHTLVVAAFALSAALTLGSLWPAGRGATLAAALAWIASVAASRLVLGVHWPTDVLAAACVGAAIPLGIDLMLKARTE
jgi:undecaprenyl-diphosphatase